jgi:aryl-alcohol dehydrogenase-like predicted oxidoreductase
VPFSPLGRGFLSGTARRAEEYPEGDFRRGDPRFQGANFDANLRAAAVVGEVGAELGATPSQVAIAWVLQQGDDVVPIPGTKRRRFLEENVAAAELTLDARQMERLDQLLPAVAGPRYNEELMSYVDR